MILHLIGWSFGKIILKDWRLLVVKIPDNTNTTLYKLNQITHQQRRGRTVPMSRIGDPCYRRLWYGFHWAAVPEVISGKAKRIFTTGSRAEDFIIADLELIGIKVTDRQEEIWGFMKHGHGFTDGRAHNVPEAPKTVHLLEIKTHKNSSFNGVVKNGVKKSKPVHYAQCQRYMIGLELKRCLYIAYNKDNSEYWSERIRIDKSFAEDLLRKEREIIIAEEAPRRTFERGWHECSWCQYQEHCFDNAPFDRNCRTCVHSDPAIEGAWHCTWMNGNHPIPREIQITGCERYQVMEIIR
jgi:hypothetical protein